MLTPPAAGEKKLLGAAKASFFKKCVADAIADGRKGAALRRSPITLPVACNIRDDLRLVLGRPV